MSSKRKRPSNEDATSSSPCTAKKTRLVPEAPTTQRVTQTTRRASVTSDLRPVGPRRKAVLGQRDESMLRMPCTNIKTNKDQEQHFRKIKQSEIDWNNRLHITEINNWRNQIYTRAGMKVKEVNVWLPDEELWIELYLHLSIAETRKRGILQPAITAIGRAFQRFFVDRILTDKHGEVVQRKQRAHNAFASKFNRAYPRLQERLKQCVRGRSGDAFVPTITEAMLDRFKALKAEMAAKGLEKESDHAEDLPAWLDFFARLPTENEDMKEDENLDTSDITPGMVEDNNVAATLVSMATKANNIATPIERGHERTVIRTRMAHPVQADHRQNAPPPTWFIAPFTPVLPANDGQVEETPNFSRSSPLSPSSDGPYTPQQGGRELGDRAGDAATKPEHTVLNAHVVYGDLN